MFIGSCQYASCLRIDSWRLPLGQPAGDESLSKFLGVSIRSAVWARERGPDAEATPCGAAYLGTKRLVVCCFVSETVNALCGSERRGAQRILLCPTPQQLRR